MEANNEEIVNLNASGPPPRPVPFRICECGCGHSYYPKRRDQIYLNKQHADFAYNHGKRKTRNRNKVRDEKILRKNDNILDKHFKTEKNVKHVDRYYDILQADGYKFGYHIGKSEKENVDYYYTYNYYYCIFFLDSIKLIKIIKR
jgi:hypothetical protein